MVKGEALLFLAGHFFAYNSNNLNRFYLLQTGLKQCPNQASCFYKGLFSVTMIMHTWYLSSFLL
jgi:hypothetical protein